MSSSAFDHDEIEEWGIYEEEDLTPVSPHPEDGLIPYLSWWPGATRSEARDFWLDGGWDE